MQKLPEAPDRKRSDACTKKGTVSTKERISFFFSDDRQSENTFLLLVDGPTSPFLCSTMVNLSTGISCLFYQQPTTKNIK